MSLLYKLQGSHHEHNQCPMIRCQFEHYYFDLEIEDHQNHPIERKREKKFIQKNCSGIFIAKKQRITLDKKKNNFKIISSFVSYTAWIFSWCSCTNHTVFNFSWNSVIICCSTLVIWPNIYIDFIQFFWLAVDK